MSGEELWQHLVAEYSRMSAESTEWNWRARAWWVLHPRWRAPLWQLYHPTWGAPVYEPSLAFTGTDLLLGIRVLCNTVYAQPRLTYDPQDCLPRRMTARSLTWAELMAR